MAKNRKQTGKGKKDSAARQLTEGDLLRRALTWIVDESIFSGLTRHGNTTWQFGPLVVLAVFWVWSDQRTLTDAFAQARELAVHLFGSVAVNTYQGLTGALTTWTAALLPLLWRRMQELMEQAGGSHWRIGKWVLLAVDGSRITTPRTRSNEAAFSAQNYGRGKKARSRKKWKNKKARSKKLSEPVKPQIWLTLLWHVGLQMPWAWKTGPSTSSERGHFLELLQTLVFPKNTLFCGDAGFVGYDLWSAVLAGGHSFLIRVGGNVRLLRNLGEARLRGDVVYLWPNETMRKKQPPIVLRLLQFQGARGMVYLVTNVLSSDELSDREASQFYRLRWGVELQFRSYKQTFGRGKLRSRTAQHALVELDWSLMGLWMVQLLAVKEQIRVGSPPQKSSVSMALRAVQEPMRSWRNAVHSPRELQLRLAASIKDDYQRKASKRARYRSRYKDAPSATEPEIIAATKKQKKTYEALATAT
jgi:hypothetical protein